MQKMTILLLVFVAATWGCVIRENRGNQTEGEEDWKCDSCLSILQTKECQSFDGDYVELAQCIRKGCETFEGMKHVRCLRFGMANMGVLRAGLKEDEKMRCLSFCQAFEFCRPDGAAQVGVIEDLCLKCQEAVVKFVQESSDHISYTEYVAAAHALCEKIAIFGFKDDCFKDMMRRTRRVGFAAYEGKLTPKTMCARTGPCAVANETETLPWPEVVGWPTFAKPRRIRFPWWRRRQPSPEDPKKRKTPATGAPPSR